MKCFIYDRTSELFGVFVKYLDTSFMFEYFKKRLPTELEKLTMKEAAQFGKLLTKFWGRLYWNLLENSWCQCWTS